MAKSRRANAVVFGFDFQVNAAIVLMIENIEDLKSLRLEGNYEDIEIELENNQYILAQAKAVERSSSDFRNVRKNLEKSLISLSEGNQKVDAQRLILITNSPNPLNEEASRSIFWGDAHREFLSLPESSQELIRRYLDNINQPLDTDKFMIQILPFETDNDIERYKVVKRVVDDFIGDLNLNIPGLGKKLLSIWHEEVFENGTKKDAAIQLKKKDLIWPIMVVATDVGYCDNSFADIFDSSAYDEIVRQYRETIPKWPDGILDYLDETERNKVLEYACNLQISQSTRLHKMLVQYKKDIADYKSKLKEAQSRPCYNPRHNKPENEPAFFKEMSDECMSRAIAILDTVFKSIESLGGSINSDLSVKIRDDIVRFRMVESQDQVKHEMTKQEAQELVKYNDDIKNHRWASKPQIRKYDKVYNGKLRIEFGERSYIRDNDSEKLEDRLGDILVTLYEKAEENRIVREAREEAERKRVEEARCREENRQRKEQEIRLVKELVNKAEDYRIAKEIREYIQAMIDSGNEDITPEWIEWALKKADWYDPSIETEDEYLGKRQHEKSAEEKEKSLQDSIRKSWYW